MNVKRLTEDFCLVRFVCQIVRVLYHSYGLKTLNLDQKPFVNVFLKLRPVRSVNEKPYPTTGIVSCTKAGQTSPKEGANTLIKT